jgi:hypothetical protein
VADTLQAKLASWRGGADGFLKFIADTKPRIPAYTGGFAPFAPSERQREELHRALDGEHRTIVLCWPRRHGKTAAAALILVWRFLTRGTQAVAIVANSERQTVDTAFRLVKVILENTPFTAALIRSGAIKLGADLIELPEAGNRIQGFSANAGALYGKRLNIAQVSELHAARSDEVFQAVASATIDSADGLVLVDSTVGSRASPLYMLYQVRDQDESLYFSHLEYRDLEDAVDNAPPWISRPALRSRSKTMFPGLFAAQHLNQWTSGSNALFPPEVIDQCRGDYSLDVKDLALGQAYTVGGGLDRAYAFSLHGDRTVTSAVLKRLEDDEPHFWVLASDRVWMSQGSAIKSNFVKYRKELGLSKLTIESPNTTDISAWAAEQDFDVESVFPSLERKAQAYTALSAAAREGRLHIHPSFDRLTAEMETFEYELTPDSAKGSMPKFHHARGAHDDHLDSLAWAVFSLRSVEIPAYAVEGISCDANGIVAPLCVLNGGSLVPECSERCRSFQQVKALYAKYRSRPGRKLSLEEFVPAKVENTGSHTIRR